jgi:8-oxo-dGTP diphosphatase
MPFSNNYFKSAFSVDNIIFGFDGDDLKVLLIKRAIEPFKDCWALPGALVHPDEDLDKAPQRSLTELTGLTDVFLEQVHTFGNVARHPQGRVITIAYYSLVNIDKVVPKPASFATELAWISINELPKLAFDHSVILEMCLRKLQQNVTTRPIGFELLAKEFTLTDLQSLYESVLNKQLDKRNFRKKFLSMNILVDTKKYQENVAHRPAKLYRFDKEKYLVYKSEGFIFEI